MKIHRILLFPALSLLIAAFYLLPKELATPAKGAPAALPRQNAPADFNASHRPDPQLTAEERALVSELLKLDLQLEECRLKYNLLEKNLKANQELTEKAREELLQNQLLLTQESRRLGGLLAFLYRCGQVSYLHLLLGTKNFSELIHQSFYLSFFIERQAKTVQKVHRLAQERRAILARLEELQGAVEKEKAQLAQTIEEIEKLRRQRRQFLTDVLRRAEGLAERLVFLETQWQRVILGLRAAMQKISSLPSGQLLPDRLIFSGGKFRAEINAATINRLLAEAAGDDFAALWAAVSPAGVTIYGFLKEPDASFALSGNFIPDPAGKKVIFSPQTLEIDSTPTDKEILTFVAGDAGISWELEENFSFLKIHEITPEQGKVTITFTGGF